MPPVTIIPLPPDRWPEARALRIQAVSTDPTAFGETPEEAAAVPDDEWRARLTRSAALDRQCSRFAEDDRQLVGTVTAVWSPRAKMRHTADVVGVYVAPSHRGMGVSRRLMTAVLDAVTGLDWMHKASLQVNAENPVPIALYASLGFVEVGRLQDEFYVDGRYYDTLLMEKLLRSP